MYLYFIVIIQISDKIETLDLETNNNNDVEKVVLGLLYLGCGGIDEAHDIFFFISQSHFHLIQSNILLLHTAGPLQPPSLVLLYLKVMLNRMPLTCMQ